MALWRITYWQIFSSIIYFYICLILFRIFLAKIKHEHVTSGFYVFLPLKHQNKLALKVHMDLISDYSFNMQIIYFKNEYPFGCLPAEGLSAKSGNTTYAWDYMVCGSWVPLLEIEYIQRELVVGESHLKKKIVWVYSNKVQLWKLQKQISFFPESKMGGGDELMELNVKEFVKS